MLYFVILGILKGALFALTGWGFSIVLGILGVVNFSHGVYFVMGGYLTYLFAGAGLNPLLALLAASLIVSVFALVIQYLFVNRVMAYSHMMVLVLTLGVTILTREIMGKLFGYNEKLLVIPGVNERSITLFGNDYPLLEIGAYVLSVGVFGLFYAIFHYTSLGLRLRAIGENVEISRIMGINAKWVYDLAMLLCGFMTGLAGGLAVFVLPIDLHQDTYWTVMSFLLVIIGGTGNIIGTFISAAMISVILFLSSIYIRGYSDSILYVLLFLLLIVRPSGLFKSTMVIEERK
jgi:branched-chain amino acid transport system permease protein